MAKLTDEQVRKINEVTNVPFDTAQQSALIKILETVLEHLVEKAKEKAKEVEAEVKAEVEKVTHKKAAK